MGASVCQSIGMASSGSKLEQFLYEKHFEVCVSYECKERSAQFIGLQWKTVQDFQSQITWSRAH